MTKTVHAVRRGESLDLLEPLDVPEGTELAVTIEIPPMPAQVEQFCLPVRSLGPIKGTLGREDIYAAAGWTGLARHEHPDIVLAATMMENGIKAINTYDDRFAKVPGIVALTPHPVG